MRTTIILVVLVAIAFCSVHGEKSEPTQKQREIAERSRTNYGKGFHDDCSHSDNDDKSKSRSESQDKNDSCSESGCRLRKDFSNLSMRERTRYINAVLTVSSDEKYKDRYDALIATYTASFGTVAHATNAGVSQFLVWNRYFMIEYENLLREVDCRITIPYYNWAAVPAVTPFISPVWDDTTGFGSSSRQSDGCVDSGPFQVDEFFVTPSAGSGCLEREYNNADFPTQFTISTLFRENPSDFFFVLFLLMEQMNDNIRGVIGGTIETTDAANDPIFILLLAMLDVIWDTWQSFSPDHLAARYAGDDTALVVTDENITLTQLHDNSQLPGGLAVCYAELILPTPQPGPSPIPEP